MNRRKFVLDMTATTAGEVGLPLHRYPSAQAPSGNADPPIKHRPMMITQQELQARLDRAAAEFHQT